MCTICKQRGYCTSFHGYVLRHGAGSGTGLWSIILPKVCWRWPQYLEKPAYIHMKVVAPVLELGGKLTQRFLLLAHEFWSTSQAYKIIIWTENVCLDLPYSLCSLKKWLLASKYSLPELCIAIQCDDWHIPLMLKIAELEVMDRETLVHKGALRLTCNLLVLR